MTSLEKTLIIVPAFNEQDALPSTLDELKRVVGDIDVVVVDDGSADATSEVARRHGVVCLTLPFNLGVGGALRTGFQYAVRHNYQRAIQFDADGQHDPTQIAAILQALDNGADMAIGSRFLGTGDYQVGRSRGAAMGILRWSITKLAGQKFTDTSSGFRAFNEPVIEFFAKDMPIEYLGDTVEALVLACRAGFKVTEVPVTMRTRAGGQASNRRFKLVYNYLRVLVSLIVLPSKRKVK
ncbi:MAG: hypothetical protein RLZZ31_1117 [Actinomycetota bacterium]